MSSIPRTETGLKPSSKTANEPEKEPGPIVPTILLPSRRDFEDTKPDAITIPPWAFFRAMLAIAWSSIRHPLSTTVIDLSSGTILRARPRRSAVSR
jgi:hypothetical protein